MWSRAGGSESVWAVFGTENSHYLFYCLMMNTCNGGGGGGSGGRGREQTKGLHLRDRERGSVGTPVCVYVCVSGYILTDKLPNETVCAHVACTPQHNMHMHTQVYIGLKPEKCTCSAFAPLNALKVNTRWPNICGHLSLRTACTNYLGSFLTSHSRDEERS